MDSERIFCQCLKRLDIAQNYIQSPEEYVRTFYVTINGKLRHLVTYQANSNGYYLRLLHKYFSQYICLKYQQSKSSFAFAKGKNIQGCIACHLHGSTFLKADIHDYFDSICCEKMQERILHLTVPRECKTEISLLTKACFYNGSLPIGYVSSPVLSDLFLVSLDRKYAKDEKITYTRYCDDFIVSTDNSNGEIYLAEVRLNLESDLNNLGLELNRKKTYIRHLLQPGDAIHVLGLNIVKTKSEENRVTISDRYIRETCKELCAMLNSKKEISNRKEEFSRLYGRIDFIFQCSQDSYLKLKKMTEVKSGYRNGLDIRTLKKACGIEA